MDSHKDNEGKNTDEEDKGQAKNRYCKYGSRCYQKSPAHHRKFKHPSKNNAGHDNSSKKRKTPPRVGDSSNNADEPKPKKPSVSDTEKEPEPKIDTANVENKTESPKSDAENEPSKMDVDSEPSKAEDPSKTKTDDKSESPKTDDKSETLQTDSKTEPSESVETAKSSKTDDKSETSETDKKAEPSETGSKTESPQGKNESLKTDNETKPSESKNKTEIPKPPVTSVPSKDNTDQYSEARILINKIFLCNMPDDFYKFYDFCNELKPSDPSTAFKFADVKLVGPYDVLSGLITKSTPNKEKLLTHWRYYYDPPEFQTILKGNDKEGLHFGYWRDRPSSDPVFVASNCCNISHKIKPVAENVFGAITAYLEERAKKANPFEKTGFFNLLGKLKAFAKKHNITLDTQTAKMKQREKNVVARTIHGAGVVAPYNKKTQVGYRELPVTDNQLLKIVKKIDDAKGDKEREAARAELGEIVRLATIAGDECDFGTCLELGHDLLSTGCTHVQNAALAVLSIAYNQLERQAFLKIFEIHMKDRKQGCNTSALSVAPKEKC